MLAKKQQGYTIDMTNGPLMKKMLFFAVPLALSTLLQLLFNAADLVVVSRFAGDNAMAAVGANTSLINLLVKTLTSVSVGANVLAARERGAGERAEIRRTAHTAMTMSLVGGLLLLTVGLLGADWLMQWMKIPENIQASRTLYSQGMHCQAVRRQLRYFLQCIGNFILSFTRQSDDDIHIDIIKPFLPREPEGFPNLIHRVMPADQVKCLLIHRLGIDRNTAHRIMPHSLQLFSVNTVRPAGFNGKLLYSIISEASADMIEKTVQLSCRQCRGSTASDINRVKRSGGFSHLKGHRLNFPV